MAEGEAAAAERATLAQQLEAGEAGAAGANSHLPGPLYIRIPANLLLCLQDTCLCLSEYV